MNSKKMITTKILLINLLIIFCSTAFAITVHAIVPANVDVGKLDGVLVKLFGFPIVAVSYFLILFLQCTIAVRYICKRTKVSNMQTGIRLGFSFALIYIFAMQEVLVKSSPFSKYGIEFIRYQFFMGLGDAIPVFALCIVIALFTIKNNTNVDQVPKIKKKEIIYAITIITVIFLIERTIGYITGIIYSDCYNYAVPTYAWTVLFGVVFGCIYAILYPVLFFERKQIQVPIRLILIIGVNWIIFNIFAGLILKGAMPQALLRGSIDVIGLFIASNIIGRFVIKPDNSCKEHLRG